MKFKIKSFNLIQQNTALHLAVIKQNIDIIKILINNNRIDINLKDEI